MQKRQDTDSIAILGECITKIEGIVIWHMGKKVRREVDDHIYQDFFENLQHNKGSNDSNHPGPPQEGMAAACIFQGNATSRQGLF